MAYLGEERGRGNSVLSTRQLSEIVGLIYDAALDPGRWPGALERITAALRFCNASLSLMDLQSGEVPLNITSGIEEPWLGLMAQYGREVIDQWGGLETLMSHPLDEPLVLSWINPEASSEHNRYYVEWSRPQRLIDVIGVGLARDRQMFGTLGLGRHETAGPIRQADVNDMRLLIPHLQRAVAISRLLDLRQVTARTFETVLRRLSAPVFLVSARHEVLWRNPAAEDLLGTTDEIAIRAGRLWLARAAVRDAFARAVAQLLDQDGVRTHGRDLPLAMEDGRLLTLYLLPIEVGSATAAPQTVAILAGPRGLERDPCEIVASLFGLTPTEAKVLACIVRGETVKQAAERLAIGEATVRTHLLRIFDKTGVHRQPELVALVASFAVPVRPEATA